eukprot:s2032_g3.t1
MKDDEAFALANIKLGSMALADEKGNMDEAAAKIQTVMGLLRETKDIAFGSAACRFTSFGWRCSGLTPSKKSSEALLSECAVQCYIKGASRRHGATKLVLKLLEFVMSWKESLKERQVRVQARRVAAFMLDAIPKDDETFALANIKLDSMAHSDGKGNRDEAAAKIQTVRETYVLN